MTELTTHICAWCGAERVGGLAEVHEVAHLAPYIFALGIAMLIPVLLDGLLTAISREAR